MSVELEDGWHPSTKLNAVAAALEPGVGDPLPEGVTRDEVEESCYTLRTLYGEYVDELVTETELSRREAQTWVLRNLVYEGSERLSYEAVGLYIWAIGRATEGDPLSRTIVTDYHDRAEAKIERAEATVQRTGPPPYPEERYDDPTVVWVDGPVGERLQRRLGPEETFSDLLERLLDETLASVSLETLVEAYADARGSEYAAVETVYPDWDHTLRLAVETPEAGDLPAAVVDAEAVTVDGRPYEFSVSASGEVPRADAHLVLLDDERDLETGLERLRRALVDAEVTPPALVDLAAETGAVALAVGTQPVGDGARLYPVYPEDAARDPEGRLDHVERIGLDDRTLRVGTVSPVSVAEYADVASESELLWAAAGTEGIEPRALPGEPAAQRERFPKPVLWTD